MTVRLDVRALNRATLARQFLIERTDAPAPETVAHLGGLQAQEPQEPFIGLWSRMNAFGARADGAGATARDLAQHRRSAVPAAVHLARPPGTAAAIRHELVSFRDERGRLLLDLPDAPRPDPDLAVPVRFLPAFDNALLGYHDRSRIIDDEHRGLSVAGERVVLVDGRVAATWSTATGPVTVTPLRRPGHAERDAVAEEADRLTAFLSDGAGG